MGFPILFDTGDCNFKRGEHMQTTVNFSNTGTINCQTQTWCNNEFTGFTGGVWVMFADASGNIIGHTAPIQTFGVDGKWIPGKVSSRTDLWFMDWNSIPQFGPKENVVAIQVWQGEHPQNRLMQDVADFVFIGSSIATVIGDFGTAVGKWTGGSTKTAPTKAQAAEVAQRA